MDTEHRILKEVDAVFDEVLAVMSGDAAQRLEDRTNTYANAMVQREKEARHDGKPEHDLDVVGRALRAGT